MGELTNDERLRQFAKSPYLSVDDKARFAAIADELIRLRTQLATAERALENLCEFCESCQHTEMGLRWINEPKALTDALDAIRKGAG